MRHFARLTIVVLGCFLGFLFNAPAAADTYTVTLDPSARSEPATGRVILFFVTRTEPSRQNFRWINIKPIDGPFFDAPQPIASIEVKDFKPGDSVKLDGTSLAFPESLDKLSGKVRVQAILDADQTERSHDEGPGNVFSDVVTADLSAAKDDAVKLTLNHRVEIPKRVDSANLKWVRLRSELLSTFYGRDVYHKAGVALPKDFSNPNAARKQWPAIYVIPGYGGRDDGAEEYAAMLTTPKIDEIAPIAVYIVLDPESPLGHHGFVDSPCNGPRETAFITELIPYLEKEFRLVSTAEARLVTGHSSGGWSSLWLQLRHPDVFGGCWSSSPDPVDFSVFQMTDLYHDTSIFVEENGEETPSYRNAINIAGDQTVLMTVRQEKAMEHAIDPNGRSGQQWDAWDAAFSPKDDKTGCAKPLFDWKTGAIDKSVVGAWSKFDISRMIAQQWPTLGPVMRTKVHLVCGDEDNYYLNRAVEKLRVAVEKLIAEQPTADPQLKSGYIEIVLRANHNTAQDKVQFRWNNEMRRYLQSHGLQDADAKPSGK